MACYRFHNKWWFNQSEGDHLNEKSTSIIWSSYEVLKREPKIFACLILGVIDRWSQRQPIQTHLEILYVKNSYWVKGVRLHHGTHLLKIWAIQIMHPLRWWHIVKFYPSRSQPEDWLSDSNEGLMIMHKIL